MDASPPTGPIVLLTRLARIVHRRSAEDLLDIRLKDLWMLAFLRERAPVAQQAAMEALCLDANTCVLLLNELEASELVRRRRDPADRRRHIIDLTPAGLRALEDAERAQEAVEDDLLGALDADERATLRDLLRKALDGAVTEVPAAPRSA